MSLKLSMFNKSIEINILLFNCYGNFISCCHRTHIYQWKAGWQLLARNRQWQVATDQRQRNFRKQNWLLKLNCRPTLPILAMQKV